MEHRTAPSLAEAQPPGTQEATGPDPPREPGGGALSWPAPESAPDSAPAPAPESAPAPAPAPAPESAPERGPVSGPTEPARKRKHRVRRLLARILKLALAMAVITELAAVSFIWFTPPRTAFMLQNGDPIAYQYVSLNHISRYVIASAVAHEDQQLGTRVGAFSFDDFRDRAVAYLQGKDDPSGSTVPQQLVKNIFLWPEPNALRKGLEAGLATEFSLTLTPQRMMELYLNYAQFGPKLYGICAASWYYFNEPPWSMSQHQAAELMGVLPLPTLVTRAPEGGIYLGPGVHPKVWDYVNGAANVWVPRQIDCLGGWKAAVATIGISDTASDHAAERGSANPDGCASYPESVLDLLRREGIALDRNGSPAPPAG